MAQEVQRGTYVRTLKFSPSKSSPASLIREFRKVRSRKNWLQRALYTKEPTTEKTEKTATPAAGAKRKVTANGRERRVRKLVARFKRFKEQYIHGGDYNDFLHALLLQLSPTEREDLRLKTVMQQEHFIAVRRSFKELQSQRLNEDFAIDLEYNCLVSDRIRRFIRRRGSMRHVNGRWQASPHLEVPEPKPHSKTMGITRPLRLPTLLPPEYKTLKHKKWLRNGFGLLLTKEGVGAHLHPIKLVAHVLAEARLAGRLKNLEGIRKKHTVQLLNDAMRLTKSAGFTRYIVRAVSVQHDGANAIENGRNVASFRQGDKHEFLSTHFEVPNSILNSFATTQVTRRQRAGQGREHAQVETRLELRVNRAELEDLRGDADAKRVAAMAADEESTREAETERWSGLFDDIEADLVDVIGGGDAANAVEMGGYVSIVSQKGGCPHCEAGREKWLDWDYCANKTVRTDFRDLLLKHENPDAVHGRVVVPPLPGQPLRPYHCPAVGCDFELTDENVAASRAAYAAFTPAKRHRMERLHANGSNKKPNHGGNIPHRKGIHRLDAKFKPPSKLHHLLNASSTSIAVTFGYKREPAEKSAMNKVLDAANFGFRFKEPGVSAKDTKPAGPDCRRLLTDGKTLFDLLDICWPPEQRQSSDAAFEGDLAAAQEAAAAAERAAAPAPRFREVVPEESDAAYDGGLRGNVQSSIFDEPEPEPEPHTSATPVGEDGGEEEAEGEEAEGEGEDEEVGDEESDADADAAGDFSDEELDEVPDAEGVGGFDTAAAVWAKLGLSLAAYCVRYDDSKLGESAKHGEKTQAACREWSHAVRAHHPTVMHFYMHQGGAHTKEAYVECGEPDQTCDTLVELGNNRAGRIKSRISWMTRAAVPEGEKWVQRRWVNAPKGSELDEGSERPGKVRKEVEREANASLTQQIVAAEHFAQVMRQRRPVAAEAKPLATLVTGALNSRVKAEKSEKARSQRKHVLEKLEKLCK